MRWAREEEGNWWGERWWGLVGGNKKGGKIIVETSPLYVAAYKMMRSVPTLTGFNWF